MKCTLIAIGLLATTSFALRHSLVEVCTSWTPRGILSISAACPQRFVTIWRICVETQKRSTNSPAILRVRGSLFCISNTSAAVIAVRFARRRAAYIRFICLQVVTIGC